MHGEKLKFWEFIESIIPSCKKCPFFDACEKDKYSDETCADILGRMYEEKFV